MSFVLSGSHLEKTGVSVLIQDPSKCMCDLRESLIQTKMYDLERLTHPLSILPCYIQVRG